MREPHEMVHSRARVTSRYALLPLEGFPPSRLPGWGDAEVLVLASPRLGAEFVQHLVDLPASATGSAERGVGVETFYYVMSGGGVLAGAGAELTAGSFGLVPPGADAPSFTAGGDGPMRVMILHKRYEPAKGAETATGVAGHVDDVAAEVWTDNPSSRLQTLIPDDPAFDMAMNVFTFDPGCGLPVVETHVMEHGLVFLQGRGLYYLDGEWMEAEQGDFIWMGPYCPQSYVAAGPTPTKYLYYKNVNREIPL